MGKFIVVHSVKVATDFTPETFGRLTTIGPKFALPVNIKRHRKWFQVCECECGTVKIFNGYHLASGRSKSCGCLKQELASKSLYKHGGKGTSEYGIWVAMRQRCNNPLNKRYPDYGGRGISVHPDWDNTEKGFQAFFDYMGPRPSQEHSVDRHPNRNGNYEPGNVRWATQGEQARNKRNNVNLTHNGKTQCVAAWAEETGISRETIKNRLASGWTVEKSLTTEVEKRNPNDKEA